MPSILVVDDDADICHNMADIFEDFGYRVDTASDGASALELVRKHRYDVAVLDLMMPGMDGAALSDKIKKVRSGIVCLIVTAYPAHPRAEVALQAGVWKLLPKPLDFPQLMTAIDEALGQPLVLVVDDDTDLCLNVWDLLRERGYRVCMAHNVDRALELLNGEEFQAILLDMKLPDGDGSQVFQKAREHQSNVRVIVITGHGGELESQIHSLSSAGADILAKPLDVAQLLHKLEMLPDSGGED